MKQTFIMKNLICILPLTLWFACMGCAKPYHMPPPQTLKPLPTTKLVSFTLSDANTAYSAFNKYFYSPTSKLYYSTTDKDALGAIWTQAIYWDLAMDVYQRTNDTAQLKMVNDIYTGGANQYDNYNWNNTLRGLFMMI